jgi:hypothetical protein
MTALKGITLSYVTTMASVVAIAGCSSTTSPGESGKEAGVEAGRSSGGATGRGGAGGAKGAQTGGSGGGVSRDSGADASGSQGLRLQMRVTILPPSLIAVHAVKEDDGGAHAKTSDAGAHGAGPAAAASDGGSAGGFGMATPLAGVEVCVYQNSTLPCVTTQSDGTFSMTGLPPRTNLALTLKKTGYYSYLLPIQTASADMDGRGNPAQMAPSGGPAPELGFTVDLKNKGLIQVVAIAFGGTAASVDAGMFTTVPGTKVSMSPMSGKGPYFINGQDEFDLSATAFVGVAANYYNVDAGNYTLSFDNPGFDCEPVLFPFGQFGWPLTTPAHSLSLLVVPGYITGSVVALCSKAATIVKIDGG